VDLLKEQKEGAGAPLCLALIVMRTFGDLLMLNINSCNSLR